VSGFADLDRSWFETFNLKGLAVELIVATRRQALNRKGSGVLVCWSLIIALLLSVLCVLCGQIPALIRKTAEVAEDAEDCVVGQHADTPLPQKSR